MKESAAAHLRNALQILAQSDDEIGTLELKGVRARITKALAQIESGRRDGSSS